jgi:hypothetical protein
MQLLENISRLLSRFRYPVSLPEDIAADLGISLSNHLSFDALIESLSSLSPSTLSKWMPRFKAENVFQSAIRKEIFKSCSLFSYKFNQGWVVIALYFNEEARLTRVFLQSPSSETDLDLKDEYLINHASKLAISSLHAFSKKL